MGVSVCVCVCVCDVVWLDRECAGIVDRKGEENNLDQGAERNTKSKNAWLSNSCWIRPRPFIKSHEPWQRAEHQSSVPSSTLLLCLFNSVLVGHGYTIKLCIHNAVGVLPCAMLPCNPEWPLKHNHAATRERLDCSIWQTTQDKQARTWPSKVPR